MNMISASENQVMQILVVALALLKSAASNEEKIEALETTFLAKILSGNVSIPFVTTGVTLVDEATVSYATELQSLMQQLAETKIDTGVKTLNEALANNFRNILSTNFNKE